MSNKENKAVTYQFMPAKAIALFETLRMAIYWRDPGLVRQHLQAPAEFLEQALYAEDNNGNTLLGQAVELKEPVIMRLLIKAGADVGLRMGKLGMSPLHKACLSGDVPSIRVLIEEGADKEDRHPMNDNTPLMAALGNRHEEAALYLMEVGARRDMEQMNLGGATVADFSAIYANPAVFFRLFDEGVFASIGAALRVATARNAAAIMLEAIDKPEWCAALRGEEGAELLAMCKTATVRELIQSVRVVHELECTLDDAVAADSAPVEHAARPRVAPSL
jgi:hypothetical protein